MIKHTHWKSAAAGSKKPEAKKEIPVVVKQVEEPIVEVAVEEKPLPKKIRKIYFPEENREIEL